MFRVRTAVIALSFCLAPAVLAQSNLASMSGVITDAQGAVVPQARVTAINVATGVQTPVTSTSTGFYRVQNLEIGRYNLTVEHPAFASSSVKASL